MTERFHGKYLGIVVDNDDPKGLARVRVQVPEVFGEETTGWCVPCSPVRGLGDRPRRGAADRQPGATSSGRPETPPACRSGRAAPGPTARACTTRGRTRSCSITPAGHRVIVRDTSGSEAIEIEAASGAKVVLDGDGVQIAFGSQKLAVTRTSISLNDGALEVS